MVELYDNDVVKHLVATDNGRILLGEEIVSVLIFIIHVNFTECRAYNL